MRTIARAYFTLMLLVGVISLIGCSSSVSPSPTLPDETSVIPDLTDGAHEAASIENNRYLWMYNMIYIDPTVPGETVIEVIPVRNSSMHLNVLKFLEEVCTDCMTITGVNTIAPGHLEVDIEITHMMDDLRWTVFDTRAIVMFDAGHIFPVSGLTYSDYSMGDGEFLNPDGYTALHNGATLGSAPGDLQGYFQGNLATTAVPNADINGFMRYITDDPANTRNALYIEDVITRTFEFRFPGGPFTLGYAVDTSWIFPTIPTVDPMVDFPPEANCIEPWKVEVTETGPGLNYLGGSAVLEIDVYDWQGKATHGVPMIECPELFSGVKAAVWVEDGADYSRYELNLTNENLAAAGQYKILISVVDNENDPLVTPWLNLTAYQIYTIEVASPVVVTFPDPGLDLVVRNAISKPTGDIYLSDLIGLTTLDGEDSSISDIEGLQYCADLQKLGLIYNTITDISPLTGLVNLTELDLGENNIVDISPLDGLVNLTYLDLIDNNIVDISPLDDLVNLTYLCLNKNNIIDISPLDGFVNLTDLYLGDNNIVVILPLAGLVNLAKLSMGDNNIVDISSLAGLVNLTYLSLRDNNIVDVLPLVGLVNLTDLNLSDNNIVIIYALVLNASAGGLGSGDTVWLENNPLNCESLTTHINTLLGYGVTVHYSDPVINFPDANLNAAIIYYWGLPGPDFHQSEVCGQTILLAESWSIANLEGLQYCTDLENLLFSDNSITDIPPLDGLVNLTELWLDHNNISDISSLDGLVNLTGLYLTVNYIVDISPLDGLVNLTCLRLDYNNIVDISPLDGLVNLTDLRLRNNDIVVIDALVVNAAAGGLGSGDQVDLQNNPLGPDAIDNDIPTLQNTYGVTVYY